MGGKILDVGCGAGYLLSLFKEMGWETYGVEVSPLAGKIAKEKGINIYEGELYETGLIDKYFDVIVLNHSLEHMYNPTKLLLEVNKILKDDGILIIGVPNIKSMEARIFKKNWGSIRAPQHLYHFSESTLNLLLDKCGFNLKKIWFDPNPEVLIWQIFGIKNKILKTRIKFFLYALLYPFTMILSKFNLSANFIVTAKKNLKTKT